MKEICISCLLKDNMIIAWHISISRRIVPSDYYKDFYYAGVSMEKCDEIYDVKYILVKFEEDDDMNNYIFEEVSKTFYKQWQIHPEHWGQAAY